MRGEDGLLRLLLLLLIFSVVISSSTLPPSLPPQLFDHRRHSRCVQGLYLKLELKHCVELLNKISVNVLTAVELE